MPKLTEKQKEQIREIQNTNIKVSCPYGWATNCPVSDEGKNCLKCRNYRKALEVVERKGK